MATSLRSLSTGTTQPLTSEAPIVGVDESVKSEVGGSAVVAVRCLPEAEGQLLELLIECGLQPFRHKSYSLVHEGGRTASERRDAVGSLVRRLRETAIEWRAIVCPRTLERAEIGAMSAMAAKKAITSTAYVGPEAIVFDGDLTDGDPAFKQIRRTASDNFDAGFTTNLCDVSLWAQPDADKLLPQSVAADYLAGYLVGELAKSPESWNGEIEKRINRFDPSWMGAETTEWQELSALGHTYENPSTSAGLWLTRQLECRDKSTRKPCAEAIREICTPSVQAYLEELLLE